MASWKITKSITRRYNFIHGWFFHGQMLVFRGCTQHFQSTPRLQKWKKNRWMAAILESKSTILTDVSHPNLRWIKTTFIYALECMYDVCIPVVPGQAGGGSFQSIKKT